jgi:hypothetical protein
MWIIRRIRGGKAQFYSGHHSRDPVRHTVPSWSDDPDMARRWTSAVEAGNCKRDLRLGGSVVETMWPDGVPGMDGGPSNG